MSADIRFPPEIVEKIIKELWREKATLKSCALVCKSLCPPSQRQLFHFVLLRRKNQVSNLLRVLQNAPHLTSAIRYLTITQKKYSSAVFGLDGFGSDLPALLCTLSRVQSLSLCLNVIWDELTAEKQAAFRSIFSLPTLTQLSINLTTCFPASLLFQPQLTAFDWIPDGSNQFSDELEGSDSAIAGSSPKCMLKTLALPAPLSEWGFGWLTDSKCPISLHSVEALLTQIDPSDLLGLTHIMRIVQMAASSITLLHLDIDLLSPAIETIDLSQLSNLCKLYLRFHAFLQNVDTYHPLGSLNDAIRSIPEDNNVEKIGFWLEFIKFDADDGVEGRENAEDLLPWADLDKLLTEPKMKKLKTVLWRVDEHFESIIGRTLPETRGRGLMTFVPDRQDSEATPMAGVGFEFGLWYTE